MSLARTWIVSFVAVLAVLLGAPRPARGDEPLGRLPLRHYGSDDGLPSMNLYMGRQDGAGFTWIGGTAGLVRYDGLHFRRYGVEDGLPSVLVTDLAIAPDGVLWGATSRGAFFESKGELVAFGKNELPENGTYQVAFDRTGRFVVTTTRGPYVRTAGGGLDPLPGWPGGEAFAILFEPDGTLLVGQRTRLLRRRPGHLDFEDVGQDFGGTVTALVRDGTGRLWLRAGARLWAQRRGSATFEDRSVDYLGALPGPYPRRLGLDADRKLLIPSTVGLIRVDDEGGRFVPLDLPADALSLRDAWTDREGAIWVAGSGLHRETGRGLWHSSRVADGLPSNAVWGVLRASDGTLYVATETGAARSVDGRLEPLPGIDMAGYMTEGPPGTLWFAGDGKIIRYDTATHAAKEFGADAGLPPLAVVSVVADHRGNLWAAFDSGGVYRAPLAELAAPHRDVPAKLEQVMLPDADPNEMVTKIFVDGERVWLATSHGLYLDNGAEIRRFTPKDGLRSSAPSLITRLRGELCVAYVARSDISCFVYRDEHLDGVHHREIPGNLVPELLGEDALGRLWVGTTRGLLVLDGDRVDQFSRGDGAPSDDVSFDTFLAEPDGTVWVGTSAGLGRFDGRRYEGPPPPPEVTIVSGSLAGRPLDVTATGDVEESPYESALVVNLATLSNIDERHLEVEVRLFGYDDGWHAALDRGAAYQKLSGGRYRFAARARRPWGAWGPLRTYDFEVRVAIWQRWWFRGLVLLGVLLAFAKVNGYRARALQRKNAQLESIVLERTSELAGKNIAARRILDSVEQALFSVAADGTIEPEISAAACRWFGKPRPEQRAWDWLPSGEPTANRWLALGWDTFRDGFMPKEVVFDQLPRRFSGDGRTYALQWLPNETSDGALVVGTDITDTLEIERSERARHEILESLRKLHEDRSGYLEFLEEGERLLEALAAGDLGAPSEARLVHTLKGNSALFALTSFADRCHALESRVHDSGTLSVEDRRGLREHWDAATRHLLPFVDRTPQENVQISHAELASVLDAVARGEAYPELDARLRRLRFEPTRPRLERLARQARYIAERLDRGPLRVAVDDNGVRLPRELWRPLWASLVHVVRNAIDHGLEPVAERVASGKSAVASLSFETSVENGELVIAVTDDGRGIDWAKIARAARARGLAASTHDELVTALFSDGVSTADAVTAISGRGVGTSAVLEATQALGGHIRVISEAGRGARFELRFSERALDEEASRESGPMLSAQVATTRSRRFA